MATDIPPPAPGEYRDYALAYVSLVPGDTPLVKHLEGVIASTEAMLRAYPEEMLTRPHAPGEWTVQDVLQHVVDQERVFAYRTLAIARGDRTSLPGFDQEAYAAAAGATYRTLDDLLAEYRSVRAGTVSLIRGLTEEVLANTGTSDGHPLSVRAALHIIAGHELYHLDSLRENYGDYT